MFVYSHCLLRLIMKKYSQQKFSHTNLPSLHIERNKPFVMGDFCFIPIV